MAGSGKTAAALCLCLLLGGCGVSGRLSWLDQQAGRLLGAISGTSTPSMGSDALAGAMTPRDIAAAVRSLQAPDKEKIEAWLAERNLNRFGDAAGTWYASGTPLFTASGTPMERFEYILSKHPEALEILNSKF